MDGYFNDLKSTGAALKLHADGKKWLHTGDVGIMNENGTLKFKGREKRIILRYDGVKISQFDIEKVINGLDFIQNCCVVGVTDKEHNRGEVPCCNVVLKDGLVGLEDDEIKQIILDECNKKLTSKYCIKEIMIMEELPLTDVGKVDFIKLKEICNDKLN